MMLALAPTAAAAEAQSGASSALLGDWLGLKPRLADAGIILSSHYVSEAAWNPAGGQRHDVTETGQFDLGLQFDLKRLIQLDGIFQATVTFRRGHQLDQRAGLGTLQEVQEIYGRGQTWRLTQFWYEDSILHGAVDLKLGRTSPGEDFAAFSCAFQNLSFCGAQPGNVVGDYWFNWPVSQWGGRLRARHGDVYVQIAAYEENPRNLNKSFTIGRFSGATGALIPLEIGYVRGGSDGRLPGSYKIGGWASTANAPDVLLDVDHRPIVLTNQPALQRSAAYGLWLNAQQQITGRAEDGNTVSGLSLFLNVTQADRHTALIDNQIALGLFDRGLFPGRPDDDVGFGLVRTHANGRVAHGERLAGRISQGSEYAAELYYGLHPFSWLEARPNLQWVHHAGGDASAREVGVVGLKSKLTF